MKIGDRVRKRGFPHEGMVDAIRPLGVRVRWDDGTLVKERPTYCAAGELQVIESALADELVERAARSVTSEFKAFFDAQKANVEWDWDGGDGRRVLVDAVFDLDELTKKLARAALEAVRTEAKNKPPAPER